MNSSEINAVKKPSDEFTDTWRYKVGLTMILVGNGVILLALIMPVFGVGASTIGTMVVGGEIVSLASIAFLGKEGFKTIKNKGFGFVKSTYTKPLGQKRHYIGITLFITNVVTNYIIALYLWDIFGASTGEGAAPMIWGLNFSQQETMVLWLFMVGEITFLVSLYVLGGEWWGKFRSIFIWDN